MLAFLATPYLAEAMVPYSIEVAGQLTIPEGAGKVGRERADEWRGTSQRPTHSDVGSVAVQVLVRILGNGLAPLGPPLELDVVDVDSTARGRKGQHALRKQERYIAETHVSIT